MKTDEFELFYENLCRYPDENEFVTHAMLYIRLANLLSCADGYTITCNQRMYNGKENIKPDVIIYQYCKPRIIIEVKPGSHTTKSDIRNLKAQMKKYKMPGVTVLSCVGDYEIKKTIKEVTQILKCKTKFPIKVHKKGHFLLFNPKTHGYQKTSFIKSECNWQKEYPSTWSRKKQQEYKKYQLTL